MTVLKRLFLCGIGLWPVAACTMPYVHPIVRYGELDMDGDVGLRAGPLSTKSDADALGLDSEMLVQPRVDFGWAPIHASVEAFQVEFEGSGTTQSTLDFGNGQGVVANTPVDSTWDFGYYAGRAWVEGKDQKNSRSRDPEFQYFKHRIHPLVISYFAA